VVLEKRPGGTPRILVEGKGRSNSWARLRTAETIKVPAPPWRVPSSTVNDAIVVERVVNHVLIGREHAYVIERDS